MSPLYLDGDDGRGGTRMLGFVFFYLLFLIAIVVVSALVSGCSQAATPTAPTVAAQPVAVVTETPAIVTPVAPPPAPPVVPTINPNCSELDPKKWEGFTYRVSLEFAQMWNASSCDRVVTWRAFRVLTPENQPELGKGIVRTVPAGKQDFRIDIDYAGGLPNLATTCVQIDGRAGDQPNMTAANASFPPGQLFGNCSAPPPPTPPTPPMPPPPPPVQACVPAWNDPPWIAGIGPANNVPVCKPYHRTLSDGCGHTKNENKCVL